MIAGGYLSQDLDALSIVGELFDKRLRKQVGSADDRTAPHGCSKGLELSQIHRSIVMFGI